MIDHMELSVSSLDRMVAFYRRALAPLGYAVHVPASEGQVAVGFGASPGHLDFWIREGKGAPSDPRPHFAFACASRDEVRSAHEAAVGAGGTDAGAPAVLVRIGPDYYAAFVRDPDGHHVEFVCRVEEKSRK
jgi:catechol 2,3-dioxygenase-like lactoylglutathione lyase family enzyme